MDIVHISAKELAALQAENQSLKDALQEMAQELHLALNELMYAGTRADWMWRAQQAEGELAALTSGVEPGLFSKKGR